jgi:hypothetical protein
VFETRKTRIPRSWGRDLYAGIRRRLIVCPPTSQRSEVSEQNIDAVRECIGLFFRKGPVSIWSSMNSRATGADSEIVNSANMNALLQAGIYIYALGGRLSLAVLVASAACSLCCFPTPAPDHLPA